MDDTLIGLDYAIEHVGNTAVPGLEANPIIDIDIMFNDSTGFLPIKNALESLGYYQKGNQGIKDCEVFKRAGTSPYDILASIRHHLYL